MGAGANDDDAPLAGPGEDLPGETGPSEEDDLWQAIKDANDAWTRGDPRDVAPLFHAHAVMVAPAMKARLHGRDAMVESYLDYCRQAKTHAFEELDHAIDVFGDTAVVTYRFRVRYELDETVHDEVGQEVLVLIHEDDRWQVVWRTQVPLPADEP